MRFSDAKGRKVVSASTAGTVGRVSRLVVDPATRSVLAVRLRKTEDGDLLRWSDITAFGSDAVTVTDAGVLDDDDADEDVARLSGKAHRVIGKRVLTTAGDEVGTVDDIDFDPETGGVNALILTKGSLAEVPGARLLGVGSYAVVVREAP